MKTDKTVKIHLTLKKLLSPLTFKCPFYSKASQHYLILSEFIFYVNIIAVLYFLLQRYGIYRKKLKIEVASCISLI